MCGSTLYYRGENCLGSVGSCVSRRFKVSRECKGKAHFVPIQYENPHVAGLSPDHAFLAEKQWDAAL